MNLNDWLQTLKQAGYNDANAQARLCQDIVLKAVSDSRFHHHITVKGGVVMQSLTGDIRRATQDMDMDFIHYSLDDAAIDKFIQELDQQTNLHIDRTGRIEELRQQDYHGKRVYVNIHDDAGYTIQTKIDFGVHRDFDVAQDEYCFDVCMTDDGANLLINSKEQMLTEKLKSLLKFGPFSTRYKDIFDICYLVDHVERNRFVQCLHHYILDCDGMKERTITDIERRLAMTFKNSRYQHHIKASRKNWSGVAPAQAFQHILQFFRTLK